MMRETGTGGGSENMTKLSGALRDVLGIWVLGRMSGIIVILMPKAKQTKSQIRNTHQESETREGSVRK